MSYELLVKEQIEKLGDFAKTAQDLATLLDHPLTQIKKDTYGWDGPLTERTRIFNLLCAIFVTCHLEPPPLEEVLWRASLPEVRGTESSEVAEKRHEGIINCLPKELEGGKNTAVRKIEALADTLVIFPESDGFRGVTEANILATINSILVDELGLLPYRPEYGEIFVPKPLDVVGPKTLLKILVFDDRVEDLLKSGLALVGVPNLTIALLQHDSSWAFHKSTEEEKNRLLSTASLAIRAECPDIILMDQGLGDIEGSDLVERIKQDLANGSYQPVFVANTGGDPLDLYNVGCLPNFDKGKDVRGVRQALFQA